MMVIHHGVNLLLALRFARRRGCVVKPIRRTGELLVAHPLLPGRRVRVSSHRKSAPRSLTRFLMGLPRSAA
jgi:hypothetical protein